MSAAVEEYYVAHAIQCWCFTAFGINPRAPEFTEIIFPLDPPLY